MNIITGTNQMKGASVMHITTIKLLPFLVETLDVSRAVVQISRHSTPTTFLKQFSTTYPLFALNQTKLEET